MYLFRRQDKYYIPSKRETERSRGRTKAKSLKLVWGASFIHHAQSEWQKDTVVHYCMAALTTRISYIHIPYPYPNTHTCESVNHENGHKYIYVFVLFAFRILYFVFRIRFESPKTPRSAWSKVRKFLGCQSQPQKLIFLCGCVSACWFIPIVDVCVRTYLSLCWPQSNGNHF